MAAVMMATRATQLPTFPREEEHAPTWLLRGACYSEALLLLLDDISQFRDTVGDVMRHGSRCRRALSRATNEHGHGPLVFLQAIAQIWTLKCMRYCGGSDDVEGTKSGFRGMGTCHNAQHTSSGSHAPPIEFPFRHAN